MAANLKILLGSDGFMIVAPDGTESEVCDYGLLAVVCDGMGQRWGACPESEEDMEVQGYKLAMTPFIIEGDYEFDEPEGAEAEDEPEGEPEDEPEAEGEEGEEGDEDEEDGEEGEGEPEDDEDDAA